jgi:acetyltransferase-like isoleucine patch superfamily enzyme
MIAPMHWVNRLYAVLARMRRAASMARSQTIHRWALAHLGTRSVIVRPRSIVGPRWISIGDNTRISAGARLEATKVPGHGSPSIRIGSRVTAEGDLQLNCSTAVTIEDDVVLAARVFISDSSHALPGGTNVVSTIVPGEPVRVGRGSMIGIGVSIMPGVSIGECCMIGAGSVVPKDIPDGMIAAGSPARVIRANPNAAGVRNAATR